MKCAAQLYFKMKGLKESQNLMGRKATGFTNTKQYTYYMCKGVTVLKSDRFLRDQRKV